MFVPTTESQLMYVTTHQPATQMVTACSHVFNPRITDVCMDVYADVHTQHVVGGSLRLASTMTKAGL